MNAIFSFTDGVFGISNIGVCIILFTLVIYALLTPLTIKQQKFSKMSAIMNPEIKAIQKKYAGKNDQVSMMKMNEETQNVYAKYGVSPMGTCLPMLIQLPILFALYRVIWNIPAYVASVKDVFTPLVNVLLKTQGTQQFLADTVGNQVNFQRLGYTANSAIDALYKFKPADWTAMAEKFPDLSGMISQTTGSLDKMNYFLGLNISNSPMTAMVENFKAHNWILFVCALAIPILAGLSQWLNTKLMPQAAKPGRRRQFHGKLHEDDEQYDASGICILLSVTSDRSWYLLDRRCGIQRYPAGCCQQTYGKDGYGRTDPQKCGENECQT